MEKRLSLCRQNVLNAFGWSKTGDRWILAFSVAFIVGITSLKIMYPRWYIILLVKEDSLGEYLTSAVYLVSFSISAQISLAYSGLKSRFLCFSYALLSIALFFIAMEEVSWGQRIFGIETPEAIARHNHQGEITLHNLEGFPLHKAYLLVGLYGAFLGLLIPKSIKIKYPEMIDALIPHKSLFIYFFFVAALYLYYDYFSGPLVELFGEAYGWVGGKFMIAKDQEPAELLLSFGFLFFLLRNRYRLSRKILD